MKESAYPDHKEQDEFDRKALHVCAMNEDFDVVGYIRLLLKKHCTTLPYEMHPSLAGRQYSFPNMAEISRFIIRQDKQGLSLAKHMLRIVWQESMDLGLENWAIVCEPSLLRLIKLFGCEFEPLAPPTLYYGGFTQPAVLNARETVRKWKNRYPGAFEFYNSPVSQSY